jgi:hypothetical protein
MTMDSGLATRQKPTSTVSPLVSGEANERDFDRLKYQPAINIRRLHSGEQIPTSKAEVLTEHR